jgi:hypothetical protein
MSITIIQLQKYKIGSKKKLKQIEQTRACGYFNVVVDLFLQQMDLTEAKRRSQHDEDCALLFGDESEGEDGGDI